MRFTTLFFDLDDTLYDSQCGLWNAIRDRMTLYMQERIGLPPEQIPLLRRTYYEQYGTTLRGLQKHHQVDVDDYLAFVHDLPLDNYLQPAPALKEMLDSILLPKWIFTNADDAHAGRVLHRLGLENAFCGVVDIRALGFACKPEAAAYRQALALAGETDPACCVMLDDSARNLAPARQFGFTTVRVGPEAPGASIPDQLWIATILDLPKILPELWENGKQAKPD